MPLMHYTWSRWEQMIQNAVSALHAIPMDDFNHQPAPEKWSKKQILGHLIDSAANNHQRWVRAQFENTPDIRYPQNLWAIHALHAKMQTGTLIQTWQSYNLYLLALAKLIPEENLQCQVYQSDIPCTLEASMKDYVSHLEHHLRQILPNIDY